MTKNMGSADRIIRILAAVVIGILILAGQLTGTAAIILGVLAVIFLATSFISFCPLYVPFKFSTSKRTTAQK